MYIYVYTYVHVHLYVCTLYIHIYIYLHTYLHNFNKYDHYRNVARELKRLDSLSKSPIYAHFSETLGGLPVIRSFLRQKMYLRTNEVKLDDNISAYYAMKVYIYVCMYVNVFI
jgi:ABC-type multidrug transport system fused ATPase/permease subunit